MLNIHVHSLSVRGHELSGPMTLVVPPGEVHLLRGPNGCGKSLLLDVICGVHRCSGVMVELAGKTIRRSNAYVRWNAGIRRMFQTPALPSTVTVQKALAKVNVRIEQSSEWYKRITAFLTACGISSESEIGELSFGQRRAVDLVFTLSKGAYFLLDEPFSGMRTSVVPMALELIRSRAMQSASIIVVDHTAVDRPDFFDVAYDWTQPFNSDNAPRNILARFKEMPSGKVPSVSGKDIFWKVHEFHIGDRLIAGELEIVLPKRTVVLVEGGNGSGKSTLLRAMAQLPQPWSGASASVITDSHEDKLFLSPQPPKLVEDFGVIDNLGFMLSRFNRYSSDTLDQAFALLRWLGFESGHLRKRGEVLSGGEAAMVALVGAVLSPCPIMLLDEPFESLSPYTMPRVYALLQKSLSFGKSAIVVTHHPLLAATMDLRSVIRLDAGAPVKGRFLGTSLPNLNRST